MELLQGLKNPTSNQVWAPTPQGGCGQATPPTSRPHPHKQPRPLKSRPHLPSTGHTCQAGYASRQLVTTSHKSACGYLPVPVHTRDDDAMGQSGGAADFLAGRTGPCDGRGDKLIGDSSHQIQGLGSSDRFGMPSDLVSSGFTRH